MPKFVTSSADRHGKVRHRFRSNGVTRYLPGQPGSPEFEAAYQEALQIAQQALLAPQPRKLTPDEERYPAGSVAALIRDYRQTAKYRAIRPRTKDSYDGVFAIFHDKFGKALVRDIDVKFVMKMVDGNKHKPSVANNYLRLLKLLMNYAILRGDIAANPCARVKPLKVGTWSTWSEEDIAAFERRWPLGMVERRIFNLALATGQRASDLIAMRVDDIRDGFIRVKQQKTGAELLIPVIPALAADLAAFPPKGEHLIHRKDGKPYQTRSAVTHLLKDALRAAGLPDNRNLHGLRKATCRRLAEAGASEREIMAVSGHKSPQMVSVYVQAANQKKLATAAMGKLGIVQPPLSNP